MKKHLCGCGCGVAEHFSRLKEVRLEVGLDPKARRTVIAQRYHVRKVCYAPFIEELQAQRLLNEFVQRFVRQKSRWYWRLFQFRKVARLQFLINIRLRGLEQTKKISLRSATLFVVGARLSSPLWKYWHWADRNELVWRWRRGKMAGANRGTQTQTATAKNAAQNYAAR
jgi:hypothetical protein